MIDYLKGEILKKEIQYILLSVNGVGYGVLCPASTVEALAPVGEEGELFTYTHVGESVLQLYGFSKVMEKDVFLMALKVNKVGPKAGLALLSTLSVKQFIQAIVDGDYKTITKVPGIGKTLAQKIILDLKNKLKDFYAALPADLEKETVPTSSDSREAIAALVSLGYKEYNASKAVEAVMFKDIKKDISSQEIIKQALGIIQ